MSDNAPVMISGPQGHAYVDLAPVMTEPMRALALEAALEAKALLLANKPVATLAYNAHRDQDLHIETLMRRRWTVATMDAIVETLRGLENVPTMTLNRWVGESGKEEHRKVKLLCVATGKQWLKSTPENRKPPRELNSPAGEPGDWPLLGSGKIPTNVNETTLGAWCLFALIHAKEKGAILPTDGNLYCSMKYAGMFNDRASRRPEDVEPICKRAWRDSSKLSKTLEDGSVGVFTPDSNPLAALLSCEAVAVCYNHPRDDSDSGYLTSRGDLCQTLATARLYGSLEEAKRSIRSQVNSFGEPTFVIIQAQVRSLAPDLPVANSGKIGALASWLKREALLGQVDEKTKAPTPKAPRAL
jgi:hypothetical protein